MSLTDVWSTSSDTWEGNNFFSLTSGNCQADIKNFTGSYKSYMTATCPMSNRFFAFLISAWNKSLIYQKISYYYLSLLHNIFIILYLMYLKFKQKSTIHNLHFLNKYFSYWNCIISLNLRWKGGFYLVGQSTQQHWFSRAFFSFF